MSKQRSDLWSSHRRHTAGNMTCIITDVLNTTLGTRFTVYRVPIKNLGPDSSYEVFSKWLFTIPWPLSLQSLPRLEPLLMVLLQLSRRQTGCRNMSLPAVFKSILDWLAHATARMLEEKKKKRNKTGIYPQPEKHPIHQILHKPFWVEDYSMWDTMMHWLNLSLWKICTKWWMFRSIREDKGFLERKEGWSIGCACNVGGWSNTLLGVEL